MRTKTSVIGQMIRSGILKQGYAITPEDVGCILEFSWGNVHKNDIGKKCYIQDNQFYIENNQQRDERMNKEHRKSSNC